MNSEILVYLLSVKDEDYKNFTAPLIPTVDRGKILGVRVPLLRKYAKEVFKRGNYSTFLRKLPHKYSEEDNLHAFIIEQIKDFNVCIQEVERFLPYLDNWATTDMLNPRCFTKNKGELLKKIKVWLNSNKTYTVRFAIKLLMNLYLDEDFELEYLELVANIKSTEYYVNMMIAWYFATALAKRYDEAVKYLTKNKLPVWVHNKTVQKAVESYRITKERKLFLKGLKRKE